MPRMAAMVACGADSLCARAQVGFRDVRIGSRQLLINGRALMIKGVNRHEHDERRGKAITEVSSRCSRKEHHASMRRQMT